MKIRLASALVLMGALVMGAVVAESAENPKVLMKTSMGDITIELFPDKAPLTVKNFLSYVEEKFYDGTIFHRVISGFMIQGGGLTADMVEKSTKPPIKNEATNGLSNVRGTIAMGRMNAPHTATSHFYINHVNNDGLDHRNTSSEGYGYCVFGRVVDGMKVVDAIARVRTGTKSGYPDSPLETVTIHSIRVIEE